MFTPIGRGWNANTKNSLRGGVGVLDFGGQYSHLICRRIRALGVSAALLPYDTTVEELRTTGVAGVILSGGPASVYGTSSPRPDNRLFHDTIPLLGICYGYQLLVQAHGGDVQRSERREYGRSNLRILELSGIFSHIGQERIACWMSHSDSATRLSPDLSVLAASENSPFAAIRSKDGLHYGVQFHPEVRHTQMGERILANFVFEVCKAEKNWDMREILQETVRDLSISIKGKVLCATSGGVDSTVTAALLHSAVQDRVTCVFVDNGLLREDESEEVRRAFEEELKIPLHFIDASAEFLRGLKGVRDAEEKRKIIGRIFAEKFVDFARTNGEYRYLAQGTLYPDVIESGKSSGPASVIKTHHNVGGLPSDLPLELVEPLRELYKDEVRELGRLLGLPERLLKRHPFPGPGLAVRVIGEVTEEKLKICRHSNRVVEDTLIEAGLYDKVWQGFAYVGEDRVTGVSGDERRVGYQVTVKVVESADAMTADWSRVPYEILEKI